MCMCIKVYFNVYYVSGLSKYEERPNEMKNIFTGGMYGQWNLFDN